MDICGQSLCFIVFCNHKASIQSMSLTVLRQVDIVPYIPKTTATFGLKSGDRVVYLCCHATVSQSHLLPLVLAHWCASLSSCAVIGYLGAWRLSTGIGNASTTNVDGHTICLSGLQTVSFSWRPPSSSLHRGRYILARPLALLCWSLRWSLRPWAAILGHPTATIPKWLQEAHLFLDFAMSLATQDNCLPHWA